MMRTGQMPGHRAVEGAILAMAMTRTTVRVRRTLRAVRKGPGKGWDQRMGRGNRRRLSTGRGK